MLLRIALVSSVVLAIASCMTPMSQSDIADLTTCPPGVEIGDVKKNLVLAGFGIDNESPDTLITDYKQDGGRSWTRISVVKVGSELRFRLRTRSESIESVPSKTSTTTIRSAKDKKDNEALYKTEETRAERVVNDGDEVYYAERRAQYEETKRMVCGRL